MMRNGCWPGPPPELLSEDLGDSANKWPRAVQTAISVLRAAPGQAGAVSLSRMADGHSGASRGAAAPPETPLCLCLPVHQPVGGDTYLAAPTSIHNGMWWLPETHPPAEQGGFVPVPWAPHPGLSTYRELCKWHPASCYAPLVTTRQPASLPTSPAPCCHGRPCLPGPGLQQGLPFGSPPPPCPAAGGRWPGPLGRVALALLALVGEQVLLAGDCPTGPPRCPESHKPALGMGGEERKGDGGETCREADWCGSLPAGGGGEGNGCSSFTNTSH